MSVMVSVMVLVISFYPCLFPLFHVVTKLYVIDFKSLKQFDRLCHITISRWTLCAAVCCLPQSLTGSLLFLSQHHCISNPYSYSSQAIHSCIVTIIISTIVVNVFFSADSYPSQAFHELVPLKALRDADITPAELGELLRPLCRSLSFLSFSLLFCCSLSSSVVPSIFSVFTPLISHSPVHVRSTRTDAERQAWHRRGGAEAVRHLPGQSRWFIWSSVYPA